MSRTLLTFFVFAVGCSRSAPADCSADCARTDLDAPQLVADLARPPTDAGTSDTATASDGAQAPVADLAHAVDMIPPADLLPAVDFACRPFVVDPVTEQPCMPGQEQNMKTGPSSCYRKTCGCMNVAICSDCYWSSWTPVWCAP